MFRPGNRTKKSPPPASFSLSRLIKDTRSVILRLVNGRSLTAQPGCEVCVAYVASWLRHVDESIDAIGVLMQRNLSILAAPLERLMIEHVVAAAMLARDPGAWEAFLRQSTDGAKKLRDSIESHDMGAPEQLSNFIEYGLDEEQQPYRKYRKIRERFESLGDDGRRFYLLWLESTQLSHSGAPTAFAYLRETQGDIWPTVTDQPQIALDPLRTKFTCLDSLLWCAESFSAMLVDDPLGEELASLHARKEEILATLSEAQEPHG